MFSRIFARTTAAHAHCDLPCGVYDPAQARIEAESVLAVCKKYADSSDEAFRTRAIVIKEQRSELVKHHLWVLWTDYFKAPHFEKYPQLHTLFNEATKLAGAGGTKGSMDPAVAEQLLAKDRGDLQDLLGDQAGLSPGALPGPAGRRPGPQVRTGHDRPMAPPAPAPTGPELGGSAGPPPGNRSCPRRSGRERFFFVRTRYVELGGHGRWVRQTDTVRADRATIRSKMIQSTSGGVVHQHTDRSTSAPTGSAGSEMTLPKDFVEVRIPAEGAYLSVLRTATAGLAARLDFTLDEIEDLRIAVDEACAILLQKAVPGSGLTCRFELGEGALGVDVSVPTLDGKSPARDTFAWTVLAALAGQVDAHVADDGGPDGSGIGQTVTISMLKQRGVGAP